MLAVAKHQMYVSNYSGLLLPIYHNWEVAMGKGNTSSVCTCDLHVYIDTSLASGYIKNTNFQELNFWARLSQANEEKKIILLCVFFYLKTLKCFSLVLVTEKREHSDSQHPETTT